MNKLTCRSVIKNDQRDNDVNTQGYTGLGSLRDGRKARDTCEQFSDLHIGGFAKEAHQGWDAAAVLQCDLVVIVGFAVNQVPQSSASATVHIAHPVIQQVYQ